MQVASVLMLASVLADGGGSAPAGYYAALGEGSARVRAVLDSAADQSLRALEQQAGLRHFPHAILAPAVLYTQKHGANAWRGRPEELALALRIGDLLAGEDERGAYMDRLDSYWDTTMWLEAYRLLGPQLGQARAGRWRRALERNVALVAPRVEAWRDFPRYTGHYLGTSTNHYAQWAANVFLAGRLFGNAGWERVGRQVLHRFAVEQSPDGYWGENTLEGPTSGYNLLTLSAVGVYYEHSRDPAALAALQRATRFHLAFTWPSGEPIELLNDRNRYWEAWLYGNFAFSHSAEGRGLAAFLFERYGARPLDTEQLGRVAQNALYFHDGEMGPIPQRSAESRFRLQAPAGVRHSAPWSIALSGLAGLGPATSQWFLDRQSHVALYHRAKGLILTGANSRNQPELATFQERLGEKVVHTPLDAKLEMGAEGDHLWLAYHRFFAELFTPKPTEREAGLEVRINGRGPAPDDARFTLQLVLIPGQEITTGAGLRATVSEAPLTWDASQLGGWIRHNGWRLRVPPGARLRWPVRPYSPYRNGPDGRLGRAVGALSVALEFRPEGAQYVRPRESVLSFSVTVDEP